MGIPCRRSRKRSVGVSQQARDLTYEIPIAGTPGVRGHTGLAVSRVDEGETSAGGSGVANLADLLVELAGLPDDASDLEGCLRLIARRVADTVAGVDYASVTSSRDGQATTVAMSSDVALEVDSSQYAGGGPCLDALGGQPVAVEDIAADMQWPDFRRTAIKL